MNKILETYDQGVVVFQRQLSAIVLLLARIWVAFVFIRSGWLKFESWDSTLYLFELEYQVPLIPWLWAAYLGTATELIVPVFIAIGLLTRLSAAVLFLFNIIAVVSYPVLWPGGFYDHQLWGFMMLSIVIWGAGPYSLDALFLKRRTH